MRIRTRELFKTELKSTALHRREAKLAARKFDRRASKASLNDYATADELYYTAYCLRFSKASRARHLNIAYGLLRGRKYRQIEAACNMRPSPKAVHEIMKSLASRYDLNDWPLEKVREALREEI